MKISYSISMGFHVYFIVDQLKIPHFIGLPMKILLFMGSEETFM